MSVCVCLRARFRLHMTAQFRACHACHFFKLALVLPMEDNLYFSWRVRVLAFGMVVVRRILWLPRVSSSKPTPKTVQVSYITLALLIFELAVAAIYLLYWLVSTELFRVGTPNGG